VTYTSHNNSRLASPAKKYYEIFIFAVLMFEFVVLCPGIQQLNPWAVTPYFLSYQDFGFNSRLLIGSIFKMFSEHISSSAFYYCIIIIITCMNAFIAVTLGKVLRRSTNDKADSLKVFIMLFLASPFSLSFLFYGENFGRFDTYLIIITVIMMLIVRHKYLKWLIPVLCFIAVATYQGYVMTYMPIIAVILIYECYKNKFKKSSIGLCSITFLIIILSSLYFQFFVSGFDYKSAEAVVALLQPRTDLALSANEIIFEYFVNVNTWFFDELKIIQSFAVPYTICVLIATFPLIAVFLTLWSSAFKKAQDKFSKFIIFLCMAAPMMSLPIFIGNDWDRWISAVFITQFSLAFYFLDSGFDCILKSADKIGGYLVKHKILFVFIVLFLSTLLFALPRFLFMIMQQSAVDIFNTVLEKAKESLQ